MRKRPRMSASPLLALFLLFLASTVSAIGPPTNPLDLFVRYDVGWVDQNTGRFGGNLTFFRPQTAKFDANWALIVKFPGDKTSVETFSGVEQWSIEKNSDKSYRISIKDETILSADAALVAEDNTRNLRRFTFFFNGRVTAPASKADLFPTEYRLMAAITDPNAPTLPMVDQKDFTNRDLVRGTPNQPFGPFAAAQTNRIEVSSAGVDPDNPSPKGTDLATGPIGLGIYLGIFTIAGTVFTIGTIDRARYRSQFLKQMSQEAMPVKNQFVN